MHQQGDADFCTKARKRLRKNYPTFDFEMERMIRLLDIQFCPKESAEPVSSKLKHITTNELYSVWKINVAVSGLRPGQWPRFWFGVVDDHELIVPLDIAMHKDYGTHENGIEAAALKTMERFMSTGVVEGTD